MSANRRRRIQTAAPAGNRVLYRDPQTAPPSYPAPGGTEIERLERRWTAATYLVAAFIVGWLTTNGFMFWRERLWVGVLIMLATWGAMRLYRLLVRPNPVWPALPLVIALALLVATMR